ncbi:LLM class flavin-dependent oxidoreductase [Occultella glacieicola]|uniref:LLM class flavin-dependent oxidoreductase n=1 Tax=Occultella glacieicola TaxID=2518684 RepID=A0ABY2DYD8_9MICO|nr:LLM class flavin-dependent oxidoreductase [Occultella glacieicola]TDE89216.1 LLM class flavin-dependent oxidoreductase [Occultella glacieicola]
MTPSLDLLLPVGPQPFAPAEQRRVRAAVDEGLADGLWVRDLPCVPFGDQDAGQGGDPFAHLAFLAGAGLDRGLRHLGTAAIILGLRHPLVVARAVTGLQSQASCRLVLGVGTGGKPAMNDALGISGRSMRDFAGQWDQLREALLRPGDGAATTFVVPGDYRPPDMQLATSNIARWEAIEGRAEGWQTFLTTPEDYLTALDAVLTVHNGPLRVCVRADVTLTSDAPASPQVGERGRVTCNPQQLAGLLRPWVQLPVDHLLLSLRGADPLATLRLVRESL